MERHVVFKYKQRRNGKYRLNFLQKILKDGINDNKNSMTFPLDDYDKSTAAFRTFKQKYAFSLDVIQDFGQTVYL